MGRWRRLSPHPTGEEIDAGGRCPSRSLAGARGLTAASSSAGHLHPQASRTSTITALAKSRCAGTRSRASPTTDEGRGSAPGCRFLHHPEWTGVLQASAHLSILSPPLLGRTAVHDNLPKLLLQHQAPDCNLEKVATA